MTHQYAVGQMLEMRSSPSNSRRAGPCEVVFCLPHDRGPLLYRVRPVNDRVERVVAEPDLFVSSEPRPDVAPIATAFTIAISRR